jgi:phosphomannomutase
MIIGYVQDRSDRTVKWLITKQLLKMSFWCLHFVLEKPLEGLHIVVDAGNGAGGFFVVMCLLSLLGL